MNLDIKNSKILITGAAGTIGSILLEHLSAGSITCYALDRNENELYLLSQRITNKRNNIRYVLGDVQEESFLRLLFSQNKFDYVFHAAAYKQVSLMENFSFELIKNNISASNTLFNLAIEFKTKKVVFLSTDKAVYPTSKMGYTKRACEL